MSTTTLLFGALNGRSGSSSVVLGCAFLAVLIAGLWTAWQAISHRRNDSGNDPRKLFRGLCRIHKLDHSEQRLLLLLAVHHQLTQPAMLFINPDLLEPTKLGATFPAQPAELRSLREKLFAAPT